MKTLKQIKSFILGFALLIAVFINVIACADITKREAVYIPTKCKTKDIPKPTPSKDSSISQDVAEILQYTEMLERDLEFCKGK